MLPAYEGTNVLSLHFCACCAHQNGRACLYAWSSRPTIPLTIPASSLQPQHKPAPHMTCAHTACLCRRGHSGQRHPLPFPRRGCLPQPHHYSKGRGKQLRAGQLQPPAQLRLQCDAGGPQRGNSCQSLTAAVLQCSSNRDSVSRPCVSLVNLLCTPSTPFLCSAPVTCFPTSFQTGKHMKISCFGDEMLFLTVLIACKSPCGMTPRELQGTALQENCTLDRW